MIINTTETYTARRALTAASLLESFDRTGATPEQFDGSLLLVFRVTHAALPFYSRSENDRCFP